MTWPNLEPAAGANDEERGQVAVPGGASVARSSSWLSLAFGEGPQAHWALCSKSTQIDAATGYDRPSKDFVEGLVSWCARGI